MTKAVFSKVMWAGRATVSLVGLAVILALVLGIASAAFGANGQAWILGQGNVATALTSLGGQLGVNGPMLRITNNNADANDTALDLRVQDGEAPMRVDSDARVTNLNSDKLDGQDSAAFQKRVGGGCAVGSSIRSIDANGTVTCEQDDDIGGDAAGGDLSGTYPDPQLGADAVGSQEVEDRSLRVADIAIDNIPLTIDLSNLAAGNCTGVSLGGQDRVDVGDLQIVIAPPDLPLGLVPHGERANNDNLMHFRLCNISNTDINPPQLTFNVIVLRP